MNILNRFKDNVSLRYEVYVLQQEIKRLKNERKQLIDINDKDRTNTEKDFNSMLQKELDKKDKRIKNLKLKNSMLHEDLTKEKDKILKIYNTIDEQAKKICQLGINIKPFIDRLTLFHGEEINNAGAILQVSNNFKNQYEKFQKKVLPYIKEIKEEEEEEVE